MKISCPSCSAKYSIADDKVQNRLAKIRCRKCGTSIVIDGNASPPNVYAAEGATAPAAPTAAAITQGTVYSVDLGESDQRQMSLTQIMVAYNDGTISADTFVWADGFADWTALSQVDEIVTALHEAAQQDAPTAPADEVSAAGASTAPQESPWETGDAAAPPQAAAAPPQAAASPPQAVAAPAGADLFGNVATAGSEHEQASVPSPFATAAAAAPTGETGARNESSVLFSLSALTSGATPSSHPSRGPMASIPPSADNDDSGLIDLKALTATATAPNLPAVSAAPSPLATPPSPLGGPAVGAISASIAPQAPKGNKTGLIVGGFLFAAIIAAAFILQRGGDDEPVVPAAATAASVAAAPVPTAAALPTATALPTSDAKPPSTGTGKEEAAPSKPKTTRRPRTSSPKPKSSSPKPATSKPAPKAAPKKSATKGKCGCKKDDLMCLMNCVK